MQDTFSGDNAADDTGRDAKGSIREQLQIAASAMNDLQAHILQAESERDVSQQKWLVCCSKSP